MTSLIIDGISTELERKLSALAVEHGSTISLEALRVMAEALHVPPTDPVEGQPQTCAQLYAHIRDLVERYGPLDLEFPPRSPSHREVPDFSQWPD